MYTYKKQNITIVIVLAIIISSSLSVTSLNIYGGFLRIQKFSLKLTESMVCKLIDEVSREIEVIRGLKFVEPVKVKIVNTSWAIKTWVPKEDSEIPKELLYREMMFKLSLLIPHNKTIIQLEKLWVGMFIAATVGTSIYINTDYFDPINPQTRNILAHELTHILQFLHFKIEYPDELDSRLSIAALIEGDAGWTQHLYCVKTKLCIPSPPTPLYLGDMYISLNLFPYIYGEKFVRYLYEYGGWELVNRAYENPPKSTLVIMKPELYISYLTNGVDTVADVQISLSLDGELVHSDALGAYYIMLVLARFIDIEKARDIALNWRGDKAHLYRSTNISKTSWILLWNTSWSSISYAQFFYKNLTNALARYGDLVRYDENGVTIAITPSESIKHLIDVDVKGVNVFVRSKYIEE